MAPVPATDLAAVPDPNPDLLLLTLILILPLPLPLHSVPGYGLDL